MSQKIRFELNSISHRLNATLSGLEIKRHKDCREITNLVKKLDFLHKTNRYSSLLRNLFRCNNINNFKSILVEATFAYAFEVKKITLSYEETQSNSHGSVPDFLLKSKNGKKIYFELRVNQEQKKIKDEIERQLKLKRWFSILMDGKDQQKDIIRLQNNILSKVQDKNGNPIKFLSIEPEIYNIVAVDITEMTSSTVDKQDCMLAMYGDPSVEKHIRRNIYGLFQKPMLHYPDYILKRSKQFSHFQRTIHGVLFLKQYTISGPLDFELRYHLIPNNDLVKDSEANFLDKEIINPLRPWYDIQEDSEEEFDCFIEW